MIRLIPPVAVPFGPQAIAASLVGPDAADGLCFSAQLAERFGASRALLAGSGRAALVATLAAARPAGGGEVLVPGYTCWSVPAAAVRAGYRVRLYDIDPATFLPADDLGSAAGAGTTAVVLAELTERGKGVRGDGARDCGPAAGVPTGRGSGAVWPAQVSASGVTLLSFGRGKPMPLGHGGALLTRNRPVALDLPGPQAGGRGAATLVVAAALGHPLLFRLPASIPALGIGATVYDPSVDLKRPFRRWQERLGNCLLPRMDALQARRAGHAARLAQVVAECRGWSVGPWTVGPIRLPVYAPDRTTRDAVVTRLRGLGVTASALYPGTLLDIPELRAHLSQPPESLSGARQIADRLLALPVYPTLSEADIERIGAAFVTAAGGTRR